MNIVFPTDIVNLILRMNHIAPTVIYGGFIRDVHLGLTPNDVDITTNMTKEQILEMFPNAKLRTSFTGHQIIGYKYEAAEKWYLEIYPTVDDIHQKTALADYTINALLFDGNHILDFVYGLQDLKDGIIREVNPEILSHDLKTKPQLWLKTLRLQARTGFTLTPAVMGQMQGNKELITQIDTVTLRTEGYKTLGGKHIEKTINTLHALGMLSKAWQSKRKIQDIHAFGHHFKLCRLALQSDLVLIEELAQIYKFPNEIIHACKELYEAFHQSGKISNVKIKNQVIELRKIFQLMD